MKKRMISTLPPREEPTSEWLSLTDKVDVEITSEEETHPIEAALGVEDGEGWRAATSGEQIIRLTFKRPCPVRQIRVVFAEHERARTQEFVLRVATPEAGWREVARQQFNFSPGGATREIEDYQVNLPAAIALELIIVPDISGGEPRASLQQLRVA